MHTKMVLRPVSSVSGGEYPTGCDLFIELLAHRNISDETIDDVRIVSTALSPHRKSHNFMRWVNNRRSDTENVDDVADRPKRSPRAPPSRIGVCIKRPCTDPL